LAARGSGLLVKKHGGDGFTRGGHAERAEKNTTRTNYSKEYRPGSKNSVQPKVSKSNRGAAEEGKNLSGGSLAREKGCFG